MKKLPDLNSAQTTDEELMIAYQSGHEEAFRTLYERHSAKVYGFLTSKLQDRVLADDAFQATFLKLHQSRKSYDARLPFSPWLFTVCRSAMLDTLRARSRVTRIEERNPVALEQAVAPSVAETAALPNLSTLPATQREALELRYGQDLSFEEIASRLNTSTQNSRQLVSRGVKKLKMLLGETEGDK